MLEDDALCRPGLRRDRRRRRRRRRLARRARCRDRRLRSLRRRVFPRPRRRPRATSATRCCARWSARGAGVVPAGAILCGDDITPTRFLQADWSGGGGIVLSAGSAASHVAMLARARGVPMVVGARRRSMPRAGDCVLLDAEHGTSCSPGAGGATRALPRGAPRRLPAAARRADACLVRPGRDRRRHAGARAGQHRRSVATSMRIDIAHCDGVGPDAHRVPVRRQRPAGRGDAVRAPIARCWNGPAASR